VSASFDPLSRTFDDAAETYETARPDYPDELFGDLVQLADLSPGEHLLEIGCATGKATRPLLERGFSIVCLEPGPRLAAHAAANLAGLPVEILVTPFESWDGSPGQFDLVYAATAWHWLDPATRYHRAHRLLRPGGHLAFWSALHAFPPNFDPFFSEIQNVYDEIGEGHEDGWLSAPPDRAPDQVGEIEASGLFEHVTVRRYVWERRYTAQEYIDLLNTFSGHISMNLEKRAYLYDQIRERIEARADPRVRRHWYAILHVACRTDRAGPKDQA
jgi:SAM-dependent methyltransferase